MMEYLIHFEKLLILCEVCGEPSLTFNIHINNLDWKLKNRSHCTQENILIVCEGNLSRNYWKWKYHMLFTLKHVSMRHPVLVIVY